MNLAAATSLDEVTLNINALYPGTAITTAPAPGDEGRWFVIKDNLVMSGLHILRKSGPMYVFCTIDFL